MATFTNTFINGMRVDTDGHIQKNSSYRYAMGGRIAWNRLRDKSKTFEENIKAGSTLAFVVARGTRYEFSLPAGYKIIGSIAGLNETVVFSTNGQYSEIGVLTANDNIDSAGAIRYQCRYNDYNDPNFKNSISLRRAPGQPQGDRLNFNERYYIHGFGVKENQFTDRKYWVDGYNQKRTLNMSLLFNENGQPYHPSNSNGQTPAIYPKHMSAHAMDVRMDLVFPKKNFYRRITGSLKSGMYQIAVKYVSKNGHSSVWSDLLLPVFVTDQRIDGVIDGNPNIYKSNHHNRTMGASNSMTEEGLRFKLTGVDTRWDEIKVAYIFHATEVTPEEINIFETITIGTQTELFVDLIANVGVGVTIGQLTQRFETIMSVGTTAQQQNRTWDGNIALLPDLAMDLKQVKIDPIPFFLRADDRIEPTFENVENPVTGRMDGDPITNTATQTGSFSMGNFTGSTEIYPIFDDFKNYKGQLCSQLLKGYFRGETYSFAFVWIDRKGNPLFAQHIGDITTPNMYDTKDVSGNTIDWTLTRQGLDNKYDLRIMGMQISNIKIPIGLLYDKFGKLNVSGFKIVRAQRNETLACQGLMFNANVSPNGKTETDGDLLVHPMEYWDNTYVLNQSGELYPNTHLYDPQDILSGSDYDGTGTDADPSPTYNIGGFFNFHSPDIAIEKQIGTARIPNLRMMAGQMEKAGFVHKSYSEYIEVFIKHYYSKLYRTSPLDFADEREKVKNSGTKLGSKSRIKKALHHTASSLEVYPQFDPETTEQIDYRVAVQVFLGGDYIFPSKSTQQPLSVVLKLQDWKRIDSVESTSSRATFPIVNWRVSPSPTETQIENRVYMDTGHFQPITEAEIGKFIPNYDDNTGQITSYTVNGIQIGGGDCYVNLYDFTRLYPEYTNCVKDGDNKYPDYSVSIISPIESKYNLALLFGRRFAANAVMPQQVSCGAANNFKSLNNGIMPRQPEDWSYNSVLTLQAPIKYYFPIPVDLKIVEKRENGIWWSPKKLYGELEDSFRQHLTSDYSEAEGEFGAIQRFGHAFDSLYVVQESGFGTMKTSLQQIVTTENGDELYVKSGDVFGGIQYISKKYGTQHKNSFWSDDNQMGFVDARMGKQIVFAQNGFQLESENDQVDDPIMAISVFFDQEIVHQQNSGKFIDIIAGFDQENKEVYTSFVHQGQTTENPTEDNRVNEFKSKTIIYNKEAGFFHGYQPVPSYIYIPCGRYLFGPDSASNKSHEIHLYNYGKYGEWFGKYYNTVLEFYVNPQPNVAKVFDNGVINCNFDAYDRISKIIHEIEDNIHTIVLSNNNGLTITRPDDRVVYSEGSLRYPMFQTQDEANKTRLRGHVLKVTIIIDNSQQRVDGIDKQCILTNFDSLFRISYGTQY